MSVASLEEHTGHLALQFPKQFIAVTVLPH
jgi:hypothetical protein